MPDKFTTRSHYQQGILDNLRRDYAARLGKTGIPVPEENHLQQEAAHAWVAALEYHEVVRCLIHFYELNEHEQKAILSLAVRIIQPLYMEPVAQ